MKVFIVLFIAVLSFASPLPEQLEDDVSEKIESDVSKILPKLPQHIKDEIFRLSQNDSSAKYFEVMNNTTNISEPTYIIGDKDTRRYRVKIKKKSRIRDGRGERKQTILSEDNTILQDENRNAYKYVKVSNDDKEMNSFQASIADNLTSRISEDVSNEKLSRTVKVMMTENTTRKEIENICETLNITSQDIWQFVSKNLGLDIHKPEDLHLLERLYRRFVKSVNNSSENTSNIFSSLRGYFKNSKNAVSYPVLGNDNIDKSENVISQEIDVVDKDLSLRPKSKLVKSHNSLNKVPERDVSETTESDIPLNTNTAVTVKESMKEYEDYLPEEMAEWFTRPNNNTEHHEVVYNHVKSPDPYTNNVTEEDSDDEDKKDFATKDSKLPSETFKNLQHDISSDANPNLYISKSNKDNPKIQANDITIKIMPANDESNALREEYLKGYFFDETSAQNTTEINSELQLDHSKLIDTKKIPEADDPWFSIMPQLEEVKDYVAPNKYFLLIPTLLFKAKYNERKTWRENMVDKHTDTQEVKDLESKELPEITKRLLDNHHNGAETLTEAMTKKTESLLDIPKPNIQHLLLLLTNDILADALKRIKVHLNKNNTPRAVIKSILKRIKSEMLMLTQFSFDTTKCLRDNLNLFIEMLKSRIKEHLKL